MKKIIHPTVNFNGTSREELIDQYCGIFTTIRATRQALQNAAPHSRDYPPHGFSSYPEARKQYQRWMKMLTDLEEEVLNVSVEVAEQA